MTPESIAKHVAIRVRSKFTEQGTALDAFGGCGGNLIQFGTHLSRATSCEIDEEKVKMSRNNAKIYEVEETTQTLHKNYLRLDPSDLDYTPDCVFLSPPWGGTNYNSVKNYSFDFLYPAFDKVIAKSLDFSSNLILYLPRNTCPSEICSVLACWHEFLGTPGSVTIEIERIRFAG